MEFGTLRVYLIITNVIMDILTERYIYFTTILYFPSNKWYTYSNFMKGKKYCRIGQVPKDMVTKLQLKQLNVDCENK